jgi:hypothetical protein
VREQPAAHQRDCRSEWSGDYLNLKASLCNERRDSCARVTEAWHSGIACNCHHLSARNALKDLWGKFKLGVLI